MAGAGAPRPSAGPSAFDLIDEVTGPRIRPFKSLGLGVPNDLPAPVGLDLPAPVGLDLPAPRASKRRSTRPPAMSGARPSSPALAPGLQATLDAIIRQVISQPPGAPDTPAPVLNAPWSGPATASRPPPPPGRAPLGRINFHRGPRTARGEREVWTRSTAAQLAAKAELRTPGLDAARWRVPALFVLTLTALLSLGYAFGEILRTQV